MFLKFPNKALTVSKVHILHIYTNSTPEGFNHQKAYIKGTKPWASFHVQLCDRSGTWGKHTNKSCKDKTRISLVTFKMTLLTRLRHTSSRRAYRVWRFLPNNTAWFWLPLCNVQGEIFKARNTASWGESWRKEQVTIIKTVEDLTNQKGPKGLHFVQLMLILQKVWETEMILVSRYLRGANIKGA